MLPCRHETPVTRTRRNPPLESQTLTDAPAGPPAPPAPFSRWGALVVSSPEDPQPAIVTAAASAIASAVAAGFIAAPPYPPSSRARAKTASSIPAVSLPVKVFC
jgi:hypothetical protein